MLNKLRLTNYRNYNSIEFEFNPNLNIIIGKNGIGKTNILESLVFVSNTKSFRTNNNLNLIKDDQEYARIELLEGNNKYKVVISKDTKSLYFNNQLYKKASDYIGKINCILFKPSDLELFNQSPKERRRLLDIEIGKVNKNYLLAVIRYENLLKDKNKLLKEEVINDELLKTINEMMATEIELIVKEREKFFEYLNKNISDIYLRISNEKKKLNIKYEKCSEIEDIKDYLDNSISRDLYYHYATYGPHHDDYGFYFDDKELNAVASQGQRRMAIIAFKLGLVEYVKEITNKIPYILLDDVLSELDFNNQIRLLNSLNKDTQVFITNTDIRSLKINREYKLIDLGG